MKVVIINGSYHQNGVATFLVDKFMSGLKCSKKDIEIVEYNLLDIPIEFCKACGCCVKDDGKKMGECPQDDYPKVKGILQDMLDCNVLVYASPVYEEAVTAIMKRFMERSMTVLYMGKAGPVARNAVDKNKTGVILVSCGTPSPANITLGITRYPVHILSMFCRAFGCKKVKNIKIAGVGSKEDISDKYIKKVNKLAVKLGNNFGSYRSE